MALDESYKSFIAGCVGGILGTIVGHPFDTLKVRLQTINIPTKFAFEHR